MCVLMMRGEKKHLHLCCRVIGRSNETNSKQQKFLVRSDKTKLVGGFNPSEKYYVVNLEIFPK